MSEEFPSGPLQRIVSQRTRGTMDAKEYAVNCLQLANAAEAMGVLVQLKLLEPADRLRLMQKFMADRPEMHRHATEALSRVG